MFSAPQFLTPFRRTGLGLAVAAVVVPILVVTLPLWSVGPTCDDVSYALVGRSGQPWWTRAGGLTRPISSFLLVRGLALLEDQPAWLAGLRIAHHTLNAGLVALVGRWGLGMPLAPAALGGLAFGLWGSHGELGFYASLHDVLATSFALMALLASTGSGRRAAAGIFFAAAAAYLCKEAAWPLPGLFLVLPLRRRPGAPSRRRAAALAAAALALVLAARYAAIGTFRGELEPSIYSTWTASLLVRCVAKLILRCAVPGAFDVWHLVAWTAERPGWVAVPLALGAVLAARGALRRGRRADPVLMALGGALLISLSPACLLSVSLESAENSRYLYLPTVLIGLLVAQAFQRALAQREAQAGGTAALMALTALLGLQGYGVYEAASRYGVASAAVSRYRAALADLLESHPAARQVVLACGPDNFRGAFAARNVSGVVGAAMVPPRHVEVLAETYEDEAPPVGCGWTWRAGGLELIGGGRGARLSPAPMLAAGLGDAAAFPGRRPTPSQHGRVAHLRAVLPGEVVRAGLVAVYRQERFEVVGQR